MPGELKLPITMTFNTLVEHAVAEEMKKRAAKTLLSEGMKAAGLGDIQKLLTTFGVTPEVINKGITLLMNYLENQAKMKSGFVPPGAAPAIGPSPGLGPTAPSTPKVMRTEISPEAMFNRHMLLMENMIKTYGDLPLSEIIKKFGGEKDTLLAQAKAAQIAG